MLKEIQMLPTALDRIVNTAGNAGIINKATTSFKANPKMQFVAACLGGDEINIPDFPGSLEA